MLTDCYNPKNTGIPHCVQKLFQKQTEFSLTKQSVVVGHNFWEVFFTNSLVTKAVSKLNI